MNGAFSFLPTAAGGKSGKFFLLAASWMEVCLLALKSLFLQSPKTTTLLLPEKKNFFALFSLFRSFSISISFFFPVLTTPAFLHNTTPPFVQLAVTFGSPIAAL